LVDVDITVPLPRKLKGKDLNVSITTKKLTVGVKGEESIIEVSLKCKNNTFI
jgi:hypothetical protein